MIQGVFNVHGGRANSVSEDCLYDCLSAPSKFNFIIVFCRWFVEWHTLFIAIERIAFTGACENERIGDLSSIVFGKISDLSGTRI